MRDLWKRSSLPRVWGWYGLRTTLTPSCTSQTVSEVGVVEDRCPNAIVLDRSVSGMP